jgi:glutathione S-transferase
MREWLAASRFTVADILMSDVLRVPTLRAFAASPVLEAYIERACARPAFKKALSDQLAHFAAGDRDRKLGAR